MVELNLNIQPLNLIKKILTSGIYMKSIFIDQKKLKEIEMLKIYKDQAFDDLLNEFDIMESHIIYFSAGESKIKEILIQKKPTFSV